MSPTERPTSSAVITMSPSLARARTFLFVPGNRPERFDKALRSGADAVVLDLEDSVAVSAKVSARQSIQDAWTDLQRAAETLTVRINPADGGLGLEDIEWLAGLSPSPAVMVPKTESSAALQDLGRRLPRVALLPMIESAKGLAALADIAGSAQVTRLVLGHIDFMVDTGIQCDDDESELTPLRFAMAMATRIHGLAPPIDGVTVSIDDEARLRADTRRALRFGFGGKLCIHPRQVAVVRDALAPTHEELDWARRVVAANAASAGSVVQVDGRMVDVPVVLRAERILARAPDAQAS
jgi:citrate lyase subunit beta/citryl-CoA lyase